MNPGAFERLTPALYGAAALIAATAVADAITSAWPFAPGSVQWRYGALGLASNFLLTLTLGVVVACAVAAQRGHGRTLLALAVVLLGAAAALLAGAVAFALDAFTLTRQVTPDDTMRFRIGAVKAVVKMAATAVIFGWLGVAAWRGGRAARAAAARERTEAPPLIGASLT